MPRISIQVTKLAILRLDLRRVDLGVVREDVLPPLLRIQLLEVNVHSFLVICKSILVISE